MRVQFGVLYVQFPGFDADTVVAADVEPAVVVAQDPVRNSGQERRLAVGVTGGEDDGAGLQGEAAVLFAVPQVQCVSARERIVPGGFQRGVGQQPGPRGSIQALDVEQVVNLADQVLVDPLVEVLLRLVNSSADVGGQGVEVVDIFRRGHLEREFRVLKREEPSGAGDPVQLVPVHIYVLQQIPVQLGGALAAADNGDAGLALQLLLAGKVVRSVQNQTAGIED